MRPVYSRAVMNDIDSRAATVCGIPGVTLMENAGRAVADAAAALVSSPDSPPGTIMVICGKGNNAGDGFVAARMLHEAGIPVTVMHLFPETAISGDAMHHFRLARESGVEILPSDARSDERLASLLGCSSLIIDSIFGTGLNAPVSGAAGQMIAHINNAAAPVLSVDIPSGIDADTGAVLGCAVRARQTVTLHAMKPGLLLYPGAEYAGTVCIADIGIPHDAENDMAVVAQMPGSTDIRAMLPARPADSHKGTFGRVLIIGGSAGMAGAPYFAAMGALRAGAGYALCAVPESILSTLAALIPEAVGLSLTETRDHTIAHSSLRLIGDALDGAQACVVGPGLRMGSESALLVRDLARMIAVRGIAAVYDADALNALAALPERPPVAGSIFTPHPKELARLLGATVDEVQSDRIAAAKRAAAEFESIIVLKGAHTIIAAPEGEVFFNSTGCSAMATAGTGDVLAGVIAGLIAQGAAPLDAACAGVYLHGLAGEFASGEFGERSVLARDVASFLSKAILHITA
jgi:ADP-dependent NAD(P)H-hydrate dehydratase / NAD(P)H-hydrate epimerase